KLGADRVIDYTREDFTREDFTRGDVRYDLIIDVVGTRSIAARRRALAGRGRLAVVGGPVKGKGFGPMVGLRRLVMVSPVVGQSVTGMPVRTSVDDLMLLAELMDSGAVVPQIERTYPLAEVPEAMRYFGEGHARGKLVVVID